MTEDLYWFGLISNLQKHFILLNVKVKILQLVRICETMTPEYLAEQLQQGLGNCQKPEIRRLAQSWTATSWDVCTHVWPGGPHSWQVGSHGSHTAP